MLAAVFSAQLTMNLDFAFLTTSLIGPLNFGRAALGAVNFSIKRHEKPIQCCRHPGQSAAQKDQTEHRIDCASSPRTVPLESP
jgi:hypothetical protein